MRCGCRVHVERSPCADGCLAALALCTVTTNRAQLAGGVIALGTALPAVSKLQNADVQWWPLRCMLCIGRHC